MYKVVSLFSGCGGADCGILGDFEFNQTKYETLPFELVYASDIDKKAVMTHQANFQTAQLVCKDICDTPSSEIPDHNVLVGGLVNDNNFLHFEDYRTATEESLLKKSNKAVTDPTKIEDIELAYTLHSKEGLSNRQIAKELGVSDKTIGKWIGQYENILARSA